MTAKEKSQVEAEAFVRKVLTETFQQKVSKGTLRAVAEKVAKTVPTKQSAQSA